MKCINIILNRPSRSRKFSYCSNAILKQMRHLMKTRHTLLTIFIFFWLQTLNCQPLSDYSTTSPHCGANDLQLYNAYGCIIKQLLWWWSQRSKLLRIIWRRIWMALEPTGAVWLSEAIAVGGWMSSLRETTDASTFTDIRRAMQKLWSTAVAITSWHVFSGVYNRVPPDLSRHRNRDFSSPKVLSITTLVLAWAML